KPVLAEGEPASFLDRVARTHCTSFNSGRTEARPFTPLLSDLNTNAHATVGASARPRASTASCAPPPGARANAPGWARDRADRPAPAVRGRAGRQPTGEAVHGAIGRSAHRIPSSDVRTAAPGRAGPALF